MTKVRKAVENTFNRVGIPYETLLKREETQDKESVSNWLTGETVEVSPLVAYCIRWVYKTTLDYERGIQSVKVSDFDRVRYFVLEQDSKAYMACLD